ncbi:heavy-metal-associated domain-containing protein [Algoriphagus sediminis]|uniref:Heavy-metal-associated domain-containing protein n=1 Tax=Algoriphagus sediminis TaxID=3057113 RepID=A0ABT7YB61_9BACT|nr:heavy-metal-associated domain-containing protein [Algoriphagus sediminis]MDN3203757.1 heavy-metal-associated domain-containing protein [Algoriphagus sediminis]
MKSQRFKTNINCSNCLAKVSPFLNESEKVKEWSVDLDSEERILTIQSEDMSEEEVFRTVLKAGFIAKPE